MKLRFDLFIIQFKFKKITLTLPGDYLYLKDSLLE